MNDTDIQCQRCGNKARVDFAECLFKGWPKCCGETMMIVGETSHIKVACDRAFEKDADRVRELSRMMGEMTGGDA